MTLHKLAKDLLGESLVGSCLSISYFYCGSILSLNFFAHLVQLGK